MEHEGAELADQAGVFWSDDTVGDGGRDLGEEAVNIGVVNRAAGDGFEFAGEIGGAKAAARGVEMVEAEAAGGRVGAEACHSDGRQGTAASIGEGEAAEGEIGRGGALASHGDSIAKVNSIDK